MSDPSRGGSGGRGHSGGQPSYSGALANTSKKETRGRSGKVFRPSSTSSHAGETGKYDDWGSLTEGSKEFPEFEETLHKKRSRGESSTDKPPSMLPTAPLSPIGRGSQVKKDIDRTFANTSLDQGWATSGAYFSEKDPNEEQTDEGDSGGEQTSHSPRPTYSAIASRGIPSAGGGSTVGGRGRGDVPKSRTDPEEGEKKTSSSGGGGHKSHPTRATYAGVTEHGLKGGRNKPDGNSHGRRGGSSKS